MVQLDILSDPICPWCYIGKAGLDTALERAGEPIFAIQWHPFQLNPDMAAGGMDRQAYLEAKFGGREGVLAAYGPVVERAKAAGLPMHLDKIARTPNTLDAHRLIHWAGIEAKQTPVVDALFAAYFVEGRDIGDREVLCDIADGAGLDAALIARLLETDSDVADLRARDAQAREMGVTGVPTFIVAGRHAVPGAQPPELWDQVIAEIAQAEAAE